MALHLLGIAWLPLAIVKLVDLPVVEWGWQCIYNTFILRCCYFVSWNHFWGGAFVTEMVIPTAWYGTKPRKIMCDQARYPLVQLQTNIS